MKETIWIFGDSYAESAESMGQKTTFDCWYERLEEEYNVVNFAISGTGPEWSLQRLIEEDAKIDGETLDRRNKKEISILFLASHPFRFNFRFYKNPRDQNFSCTGEKRHPRNDLLKYNRFIEMFFRDYVYHNGINRKNGRLTLSNMFMVNHYARAYKKCMYIQLFESCKFDSKIAQLYSSENFYICPMTFHDFTIFEPYGTMSVPNHMDEEGHQKVYELVTDFLLD